MTQLRIIRKGAIILERKSWVRQPSGADPENFRGGRGGGGGGVHEKQWTLGGWIITIVKQMLPTPSISI